jgi:transcriptional regulator with XRE-family HTH domain
MKLKEQRTILGFTQQRVAEALSVSQQTVARWEGGAEIPSKYLKDLAIVLHCRVADLLPRAPDADGSKLSAQVEPEDDTPYGTVRFKFMSDAAESQEREYPITEAQRGYLYRHLDQTRDDGATWITFDSLDNRRVLLNTAELELFEMIGDDVEAMPLWEHEEVYKALSDREMLWLLDDDVTSVGADATAAYSDKLIEACRALVASWGGIDTASDRMTGIVIETVQGDRKTFSGEDADLASVCALTMNIDDPDLVRGDAPMNQWIVSLDSEGYYRSAHYRLGGLRMIEVPVVAAESAWRREMQVDDEPA